MMRLNNQLLNIWVRNLEVVVIVILLFYFLGVRAPSIIPKLMKALSYAMIPVVITFYWKRLSWVATRDIVLWLFVGIALASVLWSADAESTLNGVRGWLRMFIFGAYLATRYSIKDQMKLLTWAFGITVILSLVVTLIIPSYGLSEEHIGAWRGIFPHKNILSYSMALGAIFFLITAIKDRKPNWLAWGGFVVAVALTVMSRSSAGLMCLLVLLSLMPLYQVVKQGYKLKTVLLSLVCIVAGGVTIFILGNLETILVDILGEGLTFNGRIPIWSLIIEQGEQPWLGYGYNAFWHSDPAAFVARYAWSEPVIPTQFNAHSTYMEIFAQLGFLGVSLYVISLVTVSIRVITLLFLTKKIEFFWLLQFLAFTTVAGFADIFVSILGVSSYGSIYVSIGLSTAIELRRIRINQKRYFRTNLNELDRSHCSESKVL